MGLGPGENQGTGSRKELANKEYPDEEEDHCESDRILCDMLNALGYNANPKKYINVTVFGKKEKKEKQ